MVESGGRVLARSRESIRRRLRRGGWIGLTGRPPPQPPGWIVGPPDFVGVGAQRAGTTWWYELLCDHPQIQAAAGKECHFFDGYFSREFSEADVRAYHRLFPRPRGYLTGEWSPRYMHDFWAPTLLHRAAPDARILVMLRDPLRRYQSGVSHEMSRLMRAVRRGRRQYVGAMDANDALSRSLYARQLRSVLEQFDRRQVLVLQYERCVEDRAGELERTYDFLGVHPADHAPPFLDARANLSHPPSTPTDALGETARRVILRDVTELKSLIPEIDLDLWPSCQDLGPSPGT